MTQKNIGIRYCLLCDEQVSDGVQGQSSLRATLWHHELKNVVIPVAESAMPDEVEHMALKHGFTPDYLRVVNGVRDEVKEWVCISEADGWPFGYRVSRWGEA